MDKYKRLVSNTVLFAISSFSSKILSFLLMPFFTRMFGLGEFGDADLITKYAQLLLPIVSVGIANAVIRYGLDKTYNKASVFTGGLTPRGWASPSSRPAGRWWRASRTWAATPRCSMPMW